MKHNLKFGLVLGQPAILKISALLGKTNTKLEFLYILHFTFININMMKL